MNRNNTLKKHAVYEQSNKQSAIWDLIKNENGYCRKRTDNDSTLTIETLNNFFSEIRKQRKINNQQIKDSLHVLELNKNSMNLFFLAPTSRKKVMKIIKSFIKNEYRN